MKPNAINYLSLARKAGRIEVGEEPAGAAARAMNAKLLILAADAPDNTRRRARSFVAGTGQQLVTVPFTKEELGAALGRTVVSMAAITDPALALAFLNALEDPQRYAQAIADLTGRTQRVRQRQLEEKAHQKNLRQGKKRHQPPAQPPAADPKSGSGSAPRAAASGSRRQAAPDTRKQAPGNRPAGKKRSFGSRSTGKKSHGGAEL